MIRKSSVALALVSALAARAQEVTQMKKLKPRLSRIHEKKRPRRHQRPLRPPQWNFKPAPDRWSFAECMEHIAASEDYIRGSVETGVMKAPPIPGCDIAAIDAGIIASVPDRSHKFQTPEAIKPTNRFGSPQASIDYFVESRVTTETFPKTTTGLRDHAADSRTGKSGTPTNSSF